MNPEIKAAFLGPQSENYELLEQLVLEVLRDHIYWRKNYHPSDLPLIDQSDKLHNEFLNISGKMKQELFSILGELKKGVPFFSPRYLGHINSDLLIPAIVGYFGAMLYNQNNVVAESSPVTALKELEYIKALAQMINYPRLDFTNLKDAPKYSSWGHLCSGGTLANLEPMWVARNLKYFPVAVKLLSLINKEYRYLKDFEFLSVEGVKLKLSNFDLFKLLSLSPCQSLDFRNEVLTLIEDQKDNKKKFEDNLFTIQKLGIGSFNKLCSKHFKSIIEPVIIVPYTKHYCWPKIADILGIGRDNLIEIPVDNNFKMEIKELKSQIAKFQTKKIPILSVVGIVGTTEEGALDPLDDIIKLRSEFKKSGISFWIHSDAAYGGYFASMLSGTTEKALLYKEKYPAIEALKNVDSVAIDPHKLGYIPYPAGAVLYRDSRVRDHINYEAPYLSDKQDVTKAFLGKWTLEGSRPGAAAISCYLSQHCFPFNEHGYGNMLSDCIEETQEVNRSFASINSDDKRNRGFQIINLFEPELNIICFVVTSPQIIKDINSLNLLTKSIFEKFTVTGDFHPSHYNYVLSKTGYPYGKYKKQIDTFLVKCKIKASKIPNDFNLIALRSVLMNPLSAGNSKLFDDFSENLCDAAFEILPTIQIEKIVEVFKQRSQNRRMKVLIVEDFDDYRCSLKYSLEIENAIGKGIDILAANSKVEAEKLFISFEPDAAIIDLNLGKDVSEGLELIRQFKKNHFNNLIVHSAFLDDEIVLRTLDDDLGVIKENRIKKVEAEQDNDKQELNRQILNRLLTFL